MNNMREYFLQDANSFQGNKIRVNLINKQCKNRTYLTINSLLLNLLKMVLKEDKEQLQYIFQCILILVDGVKLQDMKEW